MTLASNADEKAFEGFYTDPENHPGGSRKITVDDGTIGVFRQAWIDGGGGEGEPASYTLPALVKGDRIIADFSVPPKGGTEKSTVMRFASTRPGRTYFSGSPLPPPPTTFTSRYSPMNVSVSVITRMPPG